MKSKIMIAVAVATVLSFSSCRSEKQKESDAKAAEELNEEKLKGDREKDANFMVDAANLNLTEVHLSELAYSKATMTEVKEMASMITNDHRLANAELTAIAQKNGVTLPTTPDAEATRKYDRLADKDGADFDKDYADMIKNGHEEAIKKFEEIAKETSNEELRNYANSKLAGMRTHLQHAEHCQELAAKAK